MMYVNRDTTAAGIGSWDWNLKGDKSTYHALYPRAWTVHEGNLILNIGIIESVRILKLDI